MSYPMSPSFSFRGWSLWTFMKGRERMAITLISGILAYYIADSATVATVSAGAVEVIWSLLRYFAKER